MKATTLKRAPLVLLLLASVAWPMEVSALSTRYPGTEFGPEASILGAPILPHLANNAAVAGMTRLIGRFRRDGFGAVNDGGAADFTPQAGTCPLNNGAGDGGSQLPMLDGCAIIDWASVSFVATPNLFVGSFGSNTSAVDTAAVQAAVNLSRKTHITASFVPSTQISLATSSQVIYGDGRYITRVNVPSTFPTNVSGVFAFLNGLQPGPTLKDIGIFFTQPTTTTKSSLVKYPPAIYAQGVPRFTLIRMGCYEAWACVDMRGNTGGAYVRDFQISPYYVGFNIDGAVDTVRLEDVHAWPFKGVGATATNNVLSNTSLFYESDAYGPIGIAAGRVDGLYIVGYLSFIGQGLNVYSAIQTAAPGCGFGTITGSDFDTFTGSTVTCGDWKFVGDDWTIGQANALAHVQTQFGNPTNVTISASRLLLGTSTNTTALINMGGGNLTTTGTMFETIGFDASSIQQTGGFMTLGSNTYTRSSGTSSSPLNYIKATIDLETGVALLSGQVENTFSNGTCTFINVATDTLHRIIGNVAPGCTNKYPSSVTPNAITASPGGGYYFAN